MELTQTIANITIGLLLSLIGVILFATFIIKTSNIPEALLVGALCGAPIGIAIAGVKPNLKWKSTYFVIPGYVLFVVVWSIFLNNETNINLLTVVTSLMSSCISIVIGGVIGNEVFKNGL